MRDAIRSLWNEPRAPGVPARVWRDWLLVGALVPLAVLEGVVREDQAFVWRPLAAALAIVGAILLLWRRTHPLLVVTLSFGAGSVMSVVALANGFRWQGSYLGASALLLPYALFRWGSGREAVVGLVVMLSSLAVSVVASSMSWGDAVGGTFVMLFPAALGASVRYQHNARIREREQGRLLEREQLARELHDSVAHHVSAIAVQAQAGRTVAAKRPEAALEALETIEEAASRTLDEMRTMVGALRSGDEPELAPQRGVVDIERLARVAGPEPCVRVALDEDATSLPPAIDAALYRLAQEAITNAMRHARGATRIDVAVDCDDDQVRLCVRDDGETAGLGPSGGSGYGIVGMTERATLLGGRVEAGPRPGRGWAVEAVFPREAKR